jgi:hypothetical protein
MPVKAKILTQAWGDALRLDYQIITYHLECGINFNNLSILAMDVIIVTDYVKTDHYRPIICHPILTFY